MGIGKADRKAVNPNRLPHTFLQQGVVEGNRHGKEEKKEET